MAAIVALFGFAGMSMVIIPIAAYMAIAFSVNTFAVEEKGKLDHLYLSLPLSRNSIVKGRFTFMILLLVIVLAICGAIVAVVSPSLDFGGISFEIGTKTIALMCCLGFAFGGFINLSMYPVMFRMGYEKGKIFGFYIPIFVVAAIFGVVGALATSRVEILVNWFSYWFANPLKVCGIMLLLGSVMFYASYRLSLWLYSKRDL
jgi:ABC-type transport system involved in multi-copper enzyme maturation permease subunit